MHLQMGFVPYRVGHALYVLAALAASLGACAQSVQAPSSLKSCEGALCNPSAGGYGIWTFHGTRGHGTWTNVGGEAELSVERFDAESVVIHREDVVGPTKGASAVYRGKLDGDQIRGVVEYSWAGHWNPGRTAPWSAKLDPKIAADFLAGLSPPSVNSGSVQAAAPIVLSGEFYSLTPANWGNKTMHPVRITHQGNEFSVVRLIAGSAKTAADAKVNGEPYVRGTFDANGTVARVKNAQGQWTPTRVQLVNPDHVKIGGEDFLRFTDTQSLPHLECNPDNPLHVQGDYAWYRGVAAKKDKDHKLYLCWIRISALMGLRDGQSAWGYALLTGDGVAKDDRQGFVFTEKAAHQGNFLGQFNLSRLLAAGVGTGRDEKAAEYWFHVASRNSDAPEAMQEKEGERIFGSVITGLLRDAFVRDGLCDTPEPSSARTAVEQHQLEQQVEERDRRIKSGMDCSSHAMNYLWHPPD
jgi:Sel1 repeat